ncbi:hypothetical protein DL96DRAFT_1820416 [Flagelloscypha sp. PMI_526]|nr:hypothetical protein DL96DRAFT_1820416 [Flagelloscypha sp. PMI_526]
MLTWTDSQSPTSTARLPPEIIERVVSFIGNHKALKKICLTSKIFIFPSQAKLFSRLDTSMSPDDFESVISSPHISRHVRSLVAHKQNIASPAALDVLAQSTRLRELIFTGSWGHWKTPSLQTLRIKILPYLSSLTLDGIDAPLFIITSCTSLQSLRVYEGGLYIMEGAETFRNLIDESEGPVERLGILPDLESQSMPFLTLLALDGTRNDSPRLSPLVKFIQEGKFPALKCLDLSRNGAEWFPLEDIATVTKPLMNQLVCLDIGYWPNAVHEASKVNHSQDLDLFQIRHYPRLLFFSVRLHPIQEHDPHRTPRIPKQAYSQLFHSSLHQLLKNITSFTSTHPLKVLRIYLMIEQFERLHTRIVDLLETGCPTSLKPKWRLLDTALAEHQYLEGLEKVVIPIYPKFRATRKLFEDELAKLNASRKLSFVSVDIVEYFSLLT